jgi:hypothetical protein
MKTLRHGLVAVFLLVGCGSASTHVTDHDAGSDAQKTVDARVDSPEASDSAPPPTDNTVPLVINAGPPSACGDPFTNVPYVSVTVCVPGTSDCQTIDYVDVDTGSTGLRILSSALKTKLPAQTSTTGTPVASCYGFAGGWTWGSIRLADVKIGGQLAARVPIQVVGDLPLSDAPSICSEAGQAETDADGLGGLGLIGINPQIEDCGTSCANPAYFACDGATCTDLTLPVADQVKNPLALLSQHNNGVVLQFPPVAAAGAATLTGSLILGIGTASNNDLGAAKILTLEDDVYFSTVYKGQTLSASYIDSGSNSLYLVDGSITQCAASSIGGGWFCPPSTLSLSAVNTGMNGVSSTVSFTVANANSLFSNASFTAFDDLASPGDEGAFAWGLPFFIGRTVFFAFDSAETPGGKGPYVAY